MTRERKGFFPDPDVYYRLYVDGEETEVVLVGGNKTEAYEMLEREWELCYPDVPLPKRYRCKLVYEEIYG